MPLVKDLLAIKIKQRMAELGLSFREADARCGFRAGTVQSFAYGNSQRPKPESLEALARGLGFTYKELALAAYGIVDDGRPSQQIDASPPEAKAEGECAETGNLSNPAGILT